MAVSHTVFRTPYPYRISLRSQASGKTPAKSGLEGASTYLSLPRFHLLSTATTPKTTGLHQLIFYLLSTTYRHPWKQFFHHSYLYSIPELDAPPGRLDPPAILLPLSQNTSPPTFWRLNPVDRHRCQGKYQNLIGSAARTGASDGSTSNLIHRHHRLPAANNSRCDSRNPHSTRGDCRDMHNLQ